MQFPFPLLPDLAKKGQGPKMDCQGSCKKKDKKSLKGAKALRYLMGHHSNKDVVIRGFSNLNREKEEERNKGKATTVASGKKPMKGK